MALGETLAAADEAEAGGAGLEAARVKYLWRRLVVALIFIVPLSGVSVLLSLFPAYRFYNQQVGDLLQQLERYEDAASVYQDLLEFAPGSDRGWKGLGQ